LDRLIETVQFSSSVGKGLKIEMRRQNLDRGFFDRVVFPADQQGVYRHLDVVGWIRNTVAAVFMIEHRGSVALPQDFVRLSGKKRPDTSAQPETFFFSRSEWFLGVAKPALDKRTALGWQASQSARSACERPSGPSVLARCFLVPRSASGLH